MNPEDPTLLTVPPNPDAVGMAEGTWAVPGTCLGGADTKTLYFAVTSFLPQINLLRTDQMIQTMRATIATKITI